MANVCHIPYIHVYLVIYATQKLMSFGPKEAISNVCHCGFYLGVALHGGVVILTINKIMQIIFVLLI